MSQKSAFVATCHSFPDKKNTKVHSNPSININVAEGDLKYKFAEVFLLFLVFAVVYQTIQTFSPQKNLKTSKAKRAVH